MERTLAPPFHILRCLVLVADCFFQILDNSFKFILDVIKNKVISTGSKSRYIPIHFDKLPWQHVPVWLQGMTYRLPDKIEQIIQRMHNIQPYEISAIPFRNTLIVDEPRLEELKKAANLVSKSDHKECDVEHCRKVRKAEYNKYINSKYYIH